jgi:predicted esterase
MLAARDPLGLVSEIRMRGDPDATERDYAAAGESFELCAAAVVDGPHGAFVWISPSSSGAPPPGWCALLAARRLVWVGPNRAGNERMVAGRMGLAIDSLQAVKGRLAIDSTRVYVAGFSGGAKSALRTLFYYPELFQGAVLMGAAEYFRPVGGAAPGLPTFPPRIAPPRDLERAKPRPIALVIGSHDPNHDHVVIVASAMEQDGFSRAYLHDEPGLGHELPSTKLLAGVLDAL